MDLAGPHLAVLGGALDVSDELLFLLLKLHAFPVKLALGLLKGPLVLSVQGQRGSRYTAGSSSGKTHFSEPFGRSLTTPEGPFDNSAHERAFCRPRGREGVCSGGELVVVR